MRTIKLLLLLFIPFSSLLAEDYFTYVDSSYVALEDKSYEDAETYLKKAMRLEPANPNNYILLSNLGTVQRNLLKYDDAIISYSSALMLAPKSITLLQNRASLYSEMQNWDKAYEDYTTILYLEEDDEEALYRRGLIRLEQNDTLAARLDFERIVINNPVSSKGRLGIAALLKYVANYSTAADMYSQVLKSNPNNAELYLKRSEIYYLDGKLAKAAEDINKSLTIRPDDPLALVIRGRIRYAQYDKKSALSDFIKAQELGVDPELTDAWIKKCK